jgi:hypothetical protein
VLWTTQNQYRQLMREKCSVLQRWVENKKFLKFYKKKNSMQIVDSLSLDGDLRNEGAW